MDLLLKYEASSQTLHHKKLIVYWSVHFITSNIDEWRSKYTRHPEITP